MNCGLIFAVNNTTVFENQSVENSQENFKHQLISRIVISSATFLLGFIIVGWTVFYIKRKKLFKNIALLPKWRVKTQDEVNLFEKSMVTSSDFFVYHRSISYTKMISIVPSVKNRI
jgi:hypothetical protein